MHAPKKKSPSERMFDEWVSKQYIAPTWAQRNLMMNAWSAAWNASREDYQASLMGKEPQIESSSEEQTDKEYRNNLAKALIDSWHAKNNYHPSAMAYVIKTAYKAADLIVFLDEQEPISPGRESYAESI